MPIHFLSFFEPTFSMMFLILFLDGSWRIITYSQILQTMWQPKRRIGVISREPLCKAEQQNVSNVCWDVQASAGCCSSSDCSQIYLTEQFDRITSPSLAIGTFAILRISSHVVVWKSTVHETHFYRSRCRKVCLGSRLDCWTVTVHKLAVGIDGRWQSGESDHACWTGAGVCC